LPPTLSPAMARPAASILNSRGCSATYFVTA
jgi:hypothetical protein